MTQSEFSSAIDRDDSMRAPRAHAGDEATETEAPNKNEGAAPLSQRIESYFLTERRQIFLWGQVDDASAKHIVERLLYMSAIDSQSDISLMINSPGGMNTAGFAILDAMRMIQPDVRTYCLGLAASFGALLLMCGAKGKRFALPHARVMIHQPWLPGEYRATATELRIQAEEIQKQRDEIDQIIAEATGRPFEEVAGDTDRDHWLNAEAAVEYGVIDAVAQTVGKA
ncbi:MAG: ATP-dependent Clp protease proteolytic subunit [bacterium]|nr:ATP-dependent Clp protease proteolytic subunit [bacterium]